jgi:hypothetical protein
LTADTYNIRQRKYQGVLITVRRGPMEINEQYQAYPDPEPKEEQKSKQSGSSRDRDMMGNSAKNLLSAEVEVVKDDKIQISEFVVPKSEGAVSSTLNDNSGGGG